MNTLIGDTRLILELAFVTYLAGTLTGMLLDGLLSLVEGWQRRRRRRRLRTRTIRCPVCQHRKEIVLDSSTLSYRRN